MTPTVLFGAALVATAVPVAWWAVSAPSAGSAGASLRRGFSPSIDLRTATLQQSSRERVTGPLVAAMARRARRLTPVNMMERLEHRLAAAGLLGRWSIERILATKLGIAVVAVLLGVLNLAASPGALSLLIAVMLPVCCWILPDFLLGKRADERRATVERELPDTMDQVTIAVEAGLGFEAALARVARGDSILAGELSRTLQDIQLGVARTDALDGLAHRTDAPDLRHFVMAIRQAERYGLPIANVLRVQSRELREKRRQQAEERAMKLPVKVLFPLVFCILPTLFLVILGPAVVQFSTEGLGG